MKKFLIAVIISVFFLLTGRLSPIHAATLYWVGADGANASVASNWKTTNPITCGGGDSLSAPAAGDALIFDADCDNGAVIDSSFTSVVTSIDLNSGYAGTVTLARSLQTTSTFSQTGGVFNTVSFTLDVDSTFSLNTGGTFRASSGTITMAGSMSITGGTFDTSTNAGGTVTFDGSSGSQTLGCNGTSFNLVTFNATGTTKTVSTNCALPLGSNPSVSVTTLLLNGTLSGSGTITFSANITINNAASLLSGFSGISVASSLNIQNGGVLDLSTFTSTTFNSVNMVSNATSLRLPGTAVINGATSIAGGVTTFDSGIDLNGALTISAGTFNAPSGTMTLAGALTISGTPVFNANGGTITFDGGGATLACNNVTFNKVTFANTATKTVNSTCILPLGNDPVINSGGGITLAGTFTGSGTLFFTGSGFPTFQIQSTPGLSGFSGLSFAGGTGTLTINGSTLDLSTYSTVSLVFLTLTSGTFIAPNGILDISGGMTTTGGIFNANNGTVQFIDFPFSTGNQNITGSNTFYNLRKTANKNALTISAGSTQTILGSLTLGPSSGVMTIRSSITGTPWKIDARGGRLLSNLNIKDSTNLNSNVMIASSSIDAGNNIGWSFSPTSQLIQINVDSPGDNTYTNSDRPMFRWNPATSLGNTSIASYSLFAGDFNVLDIAATRTTDLETSKYKLGYKNFSDNDQSNNQIEVQTKSSNEWNKDPLSGQNDGKLKEGIIRWRLEAHDSVGNISDLGRVLFVDLTAPKVQIIQKSYIKRSPVPTWYGKVIDLLSGPNTPSQTENGPKVASGPKEIQFVVERKTSKGYVQVETLTTPVPRPWWTCTNTEVKDDFKQNCDKYIPFSFTPKQIRASGTYRIRITTLDQAGNTSTSDIPFIAGSSLNLL